MGKAQENVDTLINMSDYFRNQHGENLSKLFLHAVNTFCSTLHPYNLLYFYERLSFDRKELECGLYAYFIF